MMTLTDIQLAEATALEPLMEKIFESVSDKRDCSNDKSEFAEINESFAADRREDGMAEAREVIQEQKVRATKEELIGELGNADCDFLRASIVEDWRKASAAIMRMHDIIYKLIALEP